MARVLILFAHPALERSRVHRRLLAHIPALPGLTLHDLYEVYPTFDVDVEREKELLLQHDVVVVQHPFFWYSTPPLVKQWEDLVLEHGWAYGREGRALRGKLWIHAISTGGSETAYQHGGHHGFTVRELLAPLEQTVRLCGMSWLPPYVVHATHRLEAEDIERAAHDYAELLRRLHDDRIDPSAATGLPSINRLLSALPAAEGDA